MSMFIDPHERASVSDERGNTIHYKPRMDFKTTAMVQDELLRIKVEEQERQRSRAGDDAEVEFTVGMERRKLALLVHNIVEWDGPDFEGVPCTREWIERLNPNEPLIEKLLNAIGEGNVPALAEPASNDEAGNSDDSASDTSQT